MPLAPPEMVESPPQRRASHVVILAALAANIAIAIVKFLAAFATRSSAMLAEAIHSLVDTGDAGLLLVGERRAARPPSARHPFGYGKELYYWSLIVAMMIFTAGGIVAIYQGIYHLLHPRMLTHSGWSYAVLAVAAVFEGSSFAVALRSLAGYRKMHGIKASLLRTVQVAKDPTVFMVVLEDGAALLGLAVAFLGVLLTTQLNDPIFDSIGSIVVGAILAGVAIVLARECRSLLIGERALLSVVDGVREVAASAPGVAEVIEANTMHIGPDVVLLTLRLRFRPAVDTTMVLAALKSIRAAIHERFTEVKHVFIDVDSFEGVWP